MLYQEETQVRNSLHIKSMHKKICQGEVKVASTYLSRMLVKSTTKEAREIGSPENSESRLHFSSKALTQTLPG